MIFDTHIHLNDEHLLNDLENNIKEANKEGVSLFLCVGYDLESSIKAIEIANTYKCVYAAIGFIPTEHKKWQEDSIDKLKELALNNKKVIAIGEIGLDYYREKEEETKLIQKEMFIKQIKLANELNLPISIHCRDAIQDCYDVLKEHKVNKAGVMHCYSGSKEMAKLFIKLGYKIAFGGVLTFKNSIVTKKVIRDISIDDIVFETDAPYLSPMPFRGKTNLPKYIVDTVKFASQLLNIDYDELCNKSFKNSLEIYHVESNENDN